MNLFTPSVIILGDPNELPNDLNVQFKIIGTLKIENQRVFFNDQEIPYQNVRNLPFDYILCSNRKVYQDNLRFLVAMQIPFGMIATTNYFRKYVSNAGFTAYSLTQDIIHKILEFENTRMVLDLDGYFFRSGSYNYPYEFMESSKTDLTRRISIDTIISNATDLEPIYRNFYSEIFSTFDEVKFRYYDVILITAEKSLKEWNDILQYVIQFSKNMIAFVNKHSPMLPLLKNANTNQNVSWLPTINGEYFMINRKIKDNCRAFVSIHKKFYMPTLPSGYVYIHAGKKNAKVELGFQGDDTGDNVSDLNLKINEYTVIYWAWKNTKSDYVGFSLYRRFFAIKDHFSIDRFNSDYVPIGKNYEHILTMNEAKKLLQDCDIVVGIPTANASGFEDDYREYFPKVPDTDGNKIYRKYFEQYQPEYLETLDKVESSHLLITNSMFFCRWALFNKYCEFVFSFLLPATRELPQDNRLLGYKAERAFTVFCMHNNLRIKYIPILLYPDKDSTEETFDREKFYRLNHIYV